MQGVPVRRIDFQGLAKTPMWDFSDYRALRQAGYEKAKKVIAEWSKEPQTGYFTPRITLRCVSVETLRLPGW